MFPKPMTDPCTRCPKAANCQTSDTYKCQQFSAVFISAWDETVAFLKQQLGLPQKEA